MQKNSVSIDSEDKFKNKYPWNYTDGLLPTLKDRYSNFKMDKKFHCVKKQLETNEEFCRERFLDWNKESGTKKKFYNSNILNEFDKHYIKNNSC